MEIDEIRQRAKRKLSADDYRKMSVSEIAQIRMDVKRLLKELDTLRAQQEQANEPLTLMELRKLDGKPVWVKDLLIPKCSAWHFVIKHDGEIRLFDAVAFGRQIVGYNATTGENYGKTWLAYRSKKE